ncbi:MAG: hypothetical protein R3D66_06130 [Alphaproteobacteria bacterium]
MTLDDFKLQADDPDTANILYILYLASFALLGLPALAAFVLAYMYRKQDTGWVASHYAYLVHTFWKGALYFLAGLLTLPLLIGILIIPATFVWWIARCVKGMRLIAQHRPVENPSSWVL